MNIVYAAEKPSIAEVLGEHLQCQVDPEAIDVQDDPGRTGRFLVRWRTNRYVMLPNGRLRLVHSLAPSA